MSQTETTTPTNAGSVGQTPASRSATIKPLGKPMAWVDDRVGIAKGLKGQIRKVFPDHWSFLIGEIALYSFVILLLSGVFLTLWFKPSMQEVIYNGPYAPLQGVSMTEAYESTLHISFDIRGGLLMRQIHHWGAILFMASITLHMLRIFFTGAFRKPREINWLIGIGLVNLAFVEGFFGYSLPDDLLSGTGLRVAEGIMRSVPVVGTYVSFFFFGGEFPGDVFIPRIYMAHVLLVPGILLALIAVHLGFVVYHKHTQYAGPGRTDRNVVGQPLMPVYMAKAGGYFFAVFGITTLMSALMQINPVWMYGPYNPAQVTADSQPDWYVGWMDGGLRVMPNLETHLWGFTLSWNVLIPGVGLLGLLYTSLALYPFFERWLTGDQREHHVLDRPRNQPTRTGLGAAGISIYALLWIAGGNDVIGPMFNVSIYSITWFVRIGIFVLPFLAFMVVRRICISLQRKDRQTVLHGYESGTIIRSPEGGFTEMHQPLPINEAYSITAHERQVPAELTPATDANGVAAKGQALSRWRTRLSEFYFGDVVNTPTVAELAEAHEHGDHHAVEIGYGDTSTPALETAEDAAAREQRETSITT
ncbi:MAG TPA: cytochrome bc complex cytochrome b subunit [Actinopolymorphaceae bacterium]|jgi:ubiquinol-cytochrome c reductase cytochrome b subunit